MVRAHCYSIKSAAVGIVGGGYYITKGKDPCTPIDIMWYATLVVVVLVVVVGGDD